MQVRNSSEYRLNIPGSPIAAYTSNEVSNTFIYTFIFRRAPGYYVLSGYDLAHIDNANYKDFDCIVFYIPGLIV